MLQTLVLQLQIALHPLWLEVVLFVMLDITYQLQIHALQRLIVILLQAMLVQLALTNIIGILQVVKVVQLQVANALEHLIVLIVLLTIITLELPA